MIRCTYLCLATTLLSLGASLAPAQQAPSVRVTTSLGSFTIELDPARAPLTVASFLRYVDDSFYDGTLFHRVVADFVVQGGGLNQDYSTRKARAPIANESGNGLMNLRGTVGLARTAEPHSGDAQFYVNITDNPDLNPLPSRWGYAVFGRVVEGMDVVDRIALSPTGAAGPLTSAAPLRPVLIEKIARVVP